MEEELSSTWGRFFPESSTLFLFGFLSCLLTGVSLQDKWGKKKKKGNPHLLIQQIFVEHLVHTRYFAKCLQVRGVLALVYFTGYLENKINLCFQNVIVVMLYVANTNNWQDLSFKN